MNQECKGCVIESDFDLCPLANKGYKSECPCNKNTCLIKVVCTDPCKEFITFDYKICGVPEDGEADV